LIYAINGVNTEKDIQLIRDMLGEKEFVGKSEYDKTAQTMTVYVSQSNLSEVILNYIQSTQENLGYTFNVKLINVIPAKVIK
ncbi:MAG TPA: hypothetical protein PLA88_11665, partial [Bacteroidales bacterium]|nr:hypothetical protein [Bacteroidales bacterium]